jgi:hypothetical protein
VRSSEVLIGQTHLTPADWPFQTVSADRPLTIAVAATGSGSAPAFVATVKLDGKEHSICLVGPDTLPSNVEDLQLTTYRAALPAAWVRPGIEVEVQVGEVTAGFTVDVKAANALTLYLVDAALFGEGTNAETSDAQLRELLARLPVSYLDVGKNPFGVWSPRRLLIDPRDDGKTPNGAETSHDAIVVSENPHCTSADQTAGTCTPHSGYGTMAGVLSALDTFREANGVGSASTWYADLTMELGGGLAGGQRGVGDDTNLVMNHELGHAWGFPHWDGQHTDYPYEGVKSERGGFGDRWALDQVRGLLLSPLCKGAERQSPMQRSGDSCLPAGSWFDPYADYEAARLLRMNLGAVAQRKGMVTYAGGTVVGMTREYTLPEESGRLQMHWNPQASGFTFRKYDEASNLLVDFAQTQGSRISQAEVEVTMFSGAVIVGGDSFVEPPLHYVGNVLEKLDPADGADYQTLWNNRMSDFYWARDLHLRFTLDDGTTFHRLYGAESELRKAFDRARFAFNLPKAIGDKVVTLEVLSRPLGQYAESSRLTAADSAENYFAKATVLATWRK